MKTSGRLVAAWWLRAGLLVVLLIGVAMIKVPLVVLEPGPARQAEEMIKIDARTYESHGSFLITTAMVDQPEGVTIPTALGAALDRQQNVVPRQTVFPSGSTRTQADQLHAAQMSESQQTAAVAALHELGIPVRPDGAFVRETTPGSDASKKLRPGDLIVAVDGKPVERLDDLTAVAGRRRPGEVVRLKVEREGKSTELSVKTVKSEDRPAKARIGVSVVQSQELPFNVTVDAAEIGGPSAGLVFALAIYDSLSPGDLTARRKIAGSGTITNSKTRFGRVGKVGALVQKVDAAEKAGADLFLAPEGNLEEAGSAANGKLKVVGVSTLNEAIKALKSRPKSADD